MDTTKLLSLLRTCISSKSLTQAKQIHQNVITLGLQNNIVLCKNLMNLYLTCQSCKNANLVFKTINNPLDISLWNGILASCTKNLMYNEALELFGDLLKCPHLRPNSFTYPSVLKSCSGLGRIGLGKMLHTYFVKSGFVCGDVVVASSLVALYGKCKLFVDATRLFDEMPERDVVCWNTVISCYYQDGNAEKALELFGKMKKLGFEPSPVTMTIAISACARLKNLERGKEMHREFVESGCIFDNFVGSALVDLYAKCGCLEMAKSVFDQMTRKSVVTWNAMIAGYGSVADSKMCIELFWKMIVDGAPPTLTTLSSALMACSRSAQLQHGKFIHGYMFRHSIEADIFVYCSLIDMYFKCGKVQSAESVFEMMPRDNVACWNVMVSGYVLAGDYLKALDIFDGTIKAGIAPDAMTFSATLSACSQLALLEKGRLIHKYISESGLETNEIVMGALLDMFAKCGAVDEALNIFHKLPQRDRVSWTSMITAYGSHGKALEALKLFGDLLLSDVKPDGVTFLAVLSASSHAGLVDKGLHYFKQMITEYHIKPGIEHYSCLIDLLGRAGMVQEAYQILENIPEIMEDFDLLSTLFAVCQSHRNTALGEEIAKLLEEKNPEDPSTLIMLSNMYATERKWEKAGRVRMKMKEQGMKKNPGCSWIEIDNRIQPFFALDNSHTGTVMVSDCLKTLAMHMEKDDILEL